MKALRRHSEVFRFILVGGLAVLIDFFSYYLLIEFSTTTPAVAKRISFILGAIWAFLGNKFFTFKVQGGTTLQIPMFIAVYAITGVANSITHDVTLHFLGWKWFSFLSATGVSTVLNYILQKFVVFRNK